MLEVSRLIPDTERSGDGRGSILSIVDAKCENVSIIRSKAGSIRSNHYHLRDYHFMYVLEGQMDYFFIDRNTEKLNYICVSPGKNVFTPPLELHATYFPVDTMMVVSSGFPRDQVAYEADTVRQTIIDAAEIDSILASFT